MCGISLIINGTSDELIKSGEAIKRRGVRHNITSIGNIKVWFSCLPITDQEAPMQPFMHNGKYFWLNGFISNYKELAVKYNINLKTNCDTELLSKFNGPRSELNGFFSVVIYDSVTEKVECFTDRYGIKQLYKYSEGDKTIICSEVKGIKAIFDLKISQASVDDWLYSFGVMTPDTIYKGVKRVDCLPFYKPKTINISYEQAKESLSNLLTQSIARNRTELKNGVFLSGGVDSGILADRLNPDYCFSMDYQDERFSEYENIKLNSRGTHLTMLCDDNLYDKYKEKTFLALDDPKAGSCYTNFALTELASKFCTVLYSGAGADEVFDGYTHRYNREVNDVIKRTEYKGFFYPSITHKEYDWLFLRAVLVVEDRMSGFHAMETRYPFLDNDFVDFALSLPSEYRKNKRILKDISGLPDQIVSGKKKGFSNPVGNKEWVEYALFFLSPVRSGGLETLKA